MVLSNLCVKCKERPVQNEGDVCLYCRRDAAEEKAAGSVSEDTVLGGGAAVAIEEQELFVETEDGASDDE